MRAEPGMGLKREPPAGVLRSEGEVVWEPLSCASGRPGRWLGAGVLQRVRGVGRRGKEARGERTGLTSEGPRGVRAFKVLFKESVSVPGV